MPGDHRRIPFRRPHVRNDGVPALLAAEAEVLHVLEQGGQTGEKILPAGYADPRPGFFQEGLLVLEILHGGAVENDLPPGGGFQDVLPPFGNEGAAAIDDGGQAVGLEKLADDVDQDDPLPVADFPAVDLAHGDEIGKSRFPDQGDDPVPPFDMTGDQDEFQPGLRLQQAAVHIQDDFFLPLVGAADDPDLFRRVHAEPGGDTALQRNGGRRRQAVVLGVSLDMDLFGGKAHGDDALPVGPRNDAHLVHPFQDGFPEEPRQPVLPERPGRDPAVDHDHLDARSPAGGQEVRPEFRFDGDENIGADQADQFFHREGNVEGVIDQGVGAGNEAFGHETSRFRGRRNDNAPFREPFPKRRHDGSRRRDLADGHGVDPDPGPAFHGFEAILPDEAQLRTDTAAVLPRKGDFEGVEGEKQQGGQEEDYIVYGHHDGAHLRRFSPACQGLFSLTAGRLWCIRGAFKKGLK